MLAETSLTAAILIPAAVLIAIAAVFAVLLAYLGRKLLSLGITPRSPYSEPEAWSENLAYYESLKTQ